jgi:hypothetical protein
VPLSELEVFRRSRLVKRVVTLKLDFVGETYRVKARVFLKNGWIIDFFEHQTKSLKRYSYHVFQGRKMIVRWDNAPHHTGLKTFPHHKHEGRKIVKSKEMTASNVLKELEKIIR